MKIKRTIIGSRTSKKVDYRYKIKDDAGRTLTFRAGAVMFATEADAQEFIENVENGTKTLDDNYRWF